MTYPAPSTTGNTVVVMLLVGFSEEEDPVVSEELGALATNEGRPAPGIVVAVGTRRGSRTDGMTSRATTECLITRLGS
jgi:hypothetical protein